MQVCYLAADPRIRLDAPTGYGSHIRKTVAAFEQEGIGVAKIIAGELRDISRTRNLYRKAGKSRFRMLQLIKTVARDFHEIVDDRRSFRAYEGILAKSPCSFIYERMSPFRSTGSRLAKRFGIPLVLEVNDPLHETFRYYPSPLKWYALKTENNLLRDATGLVVGSRRLKEYYEKQGVPSEKLRVIYPTADYEMFQPSEGADGESTPADPNVRIRIGFVGNMRRWHRADLLLEAFRTLPGRDALELLMIGDGPELESLKGKAVELGLGAGVKFLGSVKYEEVPGLLSSLDICVIPHATWYGSPTKLFEYGAMAKAVIGPRETPVDEIIDDGRTGTLIQCGEVGQLAAAMERLSGNRNLRQRLGQALRAKLMTEITWPINVGTILAMAGGNRGTT